MPEFDITGKIIKSKIEYSKIKLSNFEIVPDLEIKNCFNIKIKEVNMFLDYKLGIHTNQKCSGVFRSGNKAKEFLIKTFLN